MDHFTVALRGADVVGFCQTSLPTGWINWLGVVPDERRRGVATLLLAEAARDVRAARGTHLAAEVEAGTAGTAFLASRGFRQRGRRLLLSRRRCPRPAARPEGPPACPSATGPAIRGPPRPRRRRSAHAPHCRRGTRAAAPRTARGRRRS